MEPYNEETEPERLVTKRAKTAGERVARSPENSLEAEEPNCINRTTVNASGFPTSHPVLNQINVAIHLKAQLCHF